jgi:hypothetical protein
MKNPPDLYRISFLLQPDPIFPYADSESVLRVFERLDPLDLREAPAVREDLKSELLDAVVGLRALEPEKVLHEELLISSELLT